MRRRRVRDDRHAVRRTSPVGSGSESRVRDAIGSGALLGAENGRVERALEADDAGALRVSAGADARERLKRTTKHRCRRERARRRACFGRRSGILNVEENGGTFDARYQSASQIYQKTYLVIRQITRYAYKYIHIYLTQLAQNTTQLDQDRDCRDANDDVEEEVRGHRLAGSTAEADGLAQELLLHRLGHLAGLALGRSGRGLRLLSLRRERVGAGTVRRSSEHSTETVVEISLGWIRGDTAAWRW